MPDDNLDRAGSGEEAAPLRDIVRDEFNRMGGFLPVLEKITDHAKRKALLEHLSSRFTGIPIRGTDDRHLKGFFSYCRLKLDTLPNPAELEDFFLSAIVAFAEPGAQPGQAEVRPAQAERLDEGAASGSAIPHPPPAHHAPQPASRPPRAAHAVPRADAGRPSSIELFPGGAGKAGLPSNFARFLLPCPDLGDAIARARWLSGEITSPDGLAISFGMSGISDEDAMMEAEAEMTGEPEAFLARHGIITGQKENHLKGFGAVLNHLASHLEPADSGRALEALRDAAVAALRIYRPDHLAELQHAAGKLVVGAKALRAAALVIAAEDAFLADLPAAGEEGRPEQNLLGFPDPSGSLRPGTTLAHAMAKHLATGRQPLDAMVDSLAETRLAQLLRQVDAVQERHLIASFDAVFLSDCLSTEEGYSIAKNYDDLEPAL